MEKMTDENGEEWIVGYDLTEEAMIKAMEDNNMTMEEYDNLPLWDPIMGDEEDWVETDDMWLDDFQGEEDWA